MAILTAQLQEEKRTYEEAISRVRMRSDSSVDDGEVARLQVNIKQLSEDKQVSIVRNDD